MKYKLVDSFILTGTTSRAVYNADRCLKYYEIPVKLLVKEEAVQDCIDKIIKLQILK